MRQVFAFRFVVALVLVGATAVLGRAAAPPAPPVGAKEVPGLIKQLEKGDLQEQLGALVSLGRVDPIDAARPAVPVIVALLKKTTEPALITLGFEALMRLPATKESGAFVFSALSSKDPGTRQAAASALPAGEAWKTQLRAALQVADPSLRATVVHKYRSLASNPAEVASALAPLLRDPDRSVRSAVGQVLTEAAKGRTELAAPLMEAAKAETDELTLVFIMGALESAGGVTVTHLPALVKILREPKHENLARARAAQALGTLGADGAAATSALIAACDQDPYPLVRSSAAEALGRQGAAARSAIPMLVRLVGDRSRGNYRYAFVRALGQLANKSDAAAVETMNTAAKDVDESVQKEAREALQRWGLTPPAAPPRPSPEEYVLTRLEDADVHVRATGLQSIQHLPTVDARFVPSLTRALKDPGPECWYAAQALGRSGAAGRSAIPALIDSLKDSSMVRYAAPALVAIAPEDPRVLNALKEGMLRGESFRSDDFALTLAGAGTHAVAPLVEGLRSTNPKVVYAAALGLARLGPLAAEALPDLIRVSQTPALLTVHYTDGAGDSYGAVTRALQAVAPGNAEAQAAIKAMRGGR